MSKAKNETVAVVEEPKKRAFFFPKEERTIMAASRAEALEMLAAEKQQ